MQSPRQVERVGWSTHFSLHTPVLLWIWCSCQTLSLWHTVAPDNQITMKNNKKGIELGHSWPTVIHPGDLSKVSDDSAAPGRCPWITQQLHQIKVSSAFLPLWYFPCKSRVCCIVLLCHLPYFSLKEEETRCESAKNILVTRKVQEGFICLNNWLSVLRLLEKIQDTFASSGLDQGCVLLSAVQRITASLDMQSRWDILHFCLRSELGFFLGCPFKSHSKPGIFQVVLLGAPHFPQLTCLKTNVQLRTQKPTLLLPSAAHVKIILISEIFV